MNTTRQLGLAIFISISAISSLCSAEVDFKGKTIEWIVPFKEGAGTDTWARFNAKYLSKYLPGEPKIVVVNKPGGNSTRAVNEYAKNARTDGLQLLGTSASTQFPFLLKDSRVNYDYDDWEVLLVAQSGGVVYIPDKLITEQEDLVTKLHSVKFIYGSQGVTSLDLIPILAFELLGIDVTTIFGFRGRSGGNAAFKRGQTNIDFQTTASYLNLVKPLVDSDRAKRLFSLGLIDQQGEMLRDPKYPNLITFKELYELVHGTHPTGIKWDSWLSSYSAGFGAQKLLVLPKGTPREIIDTYKMAIDAMFTDPEYNAEKSLVFGAYNQVSGEAAEKLYKLATNVPEEHKEWIRNWLKERYKIKL